MPVDENSRGSLWGISQCQCQYEQQSLDQSKGICQLNLVPVELVSKGGLLLLLDDSFSNLNMTIDNHPDEA
jgi:hypothetical protein